jgi:hypothetical protein
MPELTLPYISAPNEIPNDTYHNREEYAKFISSSELKQMIISPKWFRYFQDNPNDTRTISLENSMKGSVYHDMLCSITNVGNLSGFEKDWAIFNPPVNLKTGNPFGFDSQAYLGAYQEFVALNPGKQICGQPEIDLANAMIKELRYGNKHLSDDINFLIKNGKAEQSHFCEYEGGFFKFRTDLKTTTKIVDWKSCQAETPKIENWSKQVVKMGYDLSAAFYQFFDFIITGKWKTYYWVAQEKVPPFDFNIIDASNWAFEITRDAETGEQIPIPHSGAQKFIKLMEIYLQCAEKDDWPGYSVFTQPDYRGRRIAVSQVPGYESSKMLNFYL